MKKLDFSRFSPPGYEVWRERVFFIVGMSCAAFYSLWFFINYSSALSNLYIYSAGKRVLGENALMADFTELADGIFNGFYILALCMLATVIIRYAYFRRGSKSIYLMKRLPDRFELHRRCIPLPVAAALCCITAAFILLVIYFAVYMIFTPSVCISGGQWRKIWGLAV